MKRKIKIICGKIQVTAELNETKTAERIWNALPIKGTVNLWGEEIYFPLPLDMPLENGQEVVELGDLGYWPPGKAFCIFFGMTPVSSDKEIRPASAVTVIGNLLEDFTSLKKVVAGTEITIEAC